MLKLGDQERPYTPVSSDDDSGFFEIVVKIYPDGRLTPNLDKLEIGDYIEARGPVGMLQYKGRGLFVKRPKNKQLQCSQLNMICGGTGITPMMQITQQILKNADDKTQINMIFGNITVDDILCHNLLENMRIGGKTRGKHFNVYYTL
eukprot:UN22915